MCSIVHSYEDGMAEASSINDLMELLSIPLEEVFFYEEYKDEPVESMLDCCLCPVRLKKTIEHAGWEYQKSNGDPTDIDVVPPLEKSVYGNFFIQNHMATGPKKIVPTRRLQPVRSTTLRSSAPARTGLSDVVLEEAANVVDGVIQATLNAQQYQTEEVPSESHDSGHDASYGGSSGYDSGGYDSGSSDGGGGCDGGCGGGD
jgi:uncharacterized membrane protein YgcG